MTTISKFNINSADCDLLHHGVAASSSPKVIACIPTWDDGDGDDNAHDLDDDEKTELVYASHLILNVACRRGIPVGTRTERIWNVRQTLRTKTDVESESASAAANVSTLTAKRVITCVTVLEPVGEGTRGSSKKTVVLVCGFSDGTLTSWHRDHRDGTWNERVLEVVSIQAPAASVASVLDGRSITDVDGFCNVDGSVLSIAACTSGGAHYFCFELTQKEEMAILRQHQRLVPTPTNTVKFRLLTSDDDQGPQGEGGSDSTSRLGIFLVGTAAPRHNKIHVLFMEFNGNDDPIHTKLAAPTYSGSLSGHEDWITCFDWTTATTKNSRSTSSGSDRTYYLASGSQDAKVRLWKWITSKTPSANTASKSQEQSTVPGLDAVLDSNDDDDDGEEDNDDDEEIVEGEARLEIVHGKDQTLTTSVFLEALLIGHEEMVTSLAWHPNPRQVYDQDLILLSSSMDRTILIWSSTSGDGEGTSNNLPNFGSGVGEGVWTPVARVGSAGGILGGSIGSSLLGFLNVKIEPVRGRWIIGHAYGGALHFFSYEASKELVLRQDEKKHEKEDRRTSDLLAAAMPIEERAALIQWRAQPCVTGHFGEVTDLCWDALGGDYLITVSNDQTCRVWAPMTVSLDAWIEIARPQVHGYNLSAVASLSTTDHRHLLVTGADEKEIRVFDGTLSFERRLRLVLATAESSGSAEDKSASDRVERAFIPALGLSNKATAADGADEDPAGASTSTTLLPLERDLGSTSLWPELRKLFGHNSEITRLTSTLSTRTCLSVQYSWPYFHQVLVASSTKARDVETACIRLWDVARNRCVQVLNGGHRSTVTAMSFSPDGTYLASSGKDRRLCIWRRSATFTESSGQNELFRLASAVESSHKRIVWSVHFCPFEPSILASGSRDGTVKLWKISEDDEGIETSVAEYLKFVPNVGEAGSTKAEAVTSLAFAPLGTRSTGILAVGFENGMIQLWNVPLLPSETEFGQTSICAAFNPQICHIGMVTRLAWRPTTIAALTEPTLLVLASCSSDNGCRIFQVRIPACDE